MANIKDVAERAGVSFSTASIVVNGKAQERKTSAATQQRVMDAMRELNYIPNVSAKSLRRGDSQSYVVALFWSFDFRGLMMNRFLFGLQKRIEEENANMSVVIRPYQTGSLRKEAGSFENGEFHAAIIANADAEDLQFLQDKQFHMPVILYNRSAEGYSSVKVDDAKIGRMAADHLYEKGYRHPVVIHGTRNFPGATRREEGFISRMEELGCSLAEPRMIYAENSIKGGYQCGEMLKAKKEKKADSYFCSSDYIASGILSAWGGSDLVPGKIGIIAIGNGDRQFSKYHYPSISVVDIPIEEMAEGCYELLVKQMYAVDSPAIVNTYETELHERQSTDRKESR